MTRRGESIIISLAEKYHTQLPTGYLTITKIGKKARVVLPKERERLAPKK